MKLQSCKAVIFVAWHGWIINGVMDRGAAANWTTERVHTKNIANVAIWYMTQVTEFAWIAVYDVWVFENIWLQEKIKKVNEICKSLWYDHTNSIMIDVHVNAWWWTGVEGRFFTWSKDSEKLATWIARSQSEILKIPQRASRWDTTNRHWRLGIVRDTRPLACLIECWFIDSAVDSELLTGLEGQRQFWQWIVRWIKRFFWIMT